MTLKNVFLILFLSLATCPLASISTYSQTTDDGSVQNNASSGIPSTGLVTTDQLLDQVCTYLKEQKAFELQMDITYENVLDSGKKVQFSAYQNVMVQKPNLLRANYVGDNDSQNFYFNGQTFTIESPLEAVYATKDAAVKTIDEVVDLIDERFGIRIPLSNLYVNDPCTAISANIQDSVFLGYNMVNREPAYHLLFIGEERDFQLWVKDGDIPLPLKVVITYKNLPQAPQYTAVLSNWNFSPEFSPNTFSFQPSEDAFGIKVLPPLSNSESK